MFKSQSLVQKILSSREEGQGLVEYALILVLVAVVVIVILTSLGPTIGNVFSTVSSGLGGQIADSGAPEPDPGDYCVDYVIENGNPWHFIWQYDGGSPSSDKANWTRVAEPGGSMSRCAWSGPVNGSR